MKQELKKWLELNINKYSNQELKITKFSDLTSVLADDPGNELIFGIILEPSDDTITFDLHLRHLDRDFNSEIGPTDYCICFDNLTQLNSGYLLMVTALK